MSLQDFGRREFIHLMASQGILLHSPGASETGHSQGYQSSEGYEYNIEIEEYHFPESVRIGEEFTANIAIRNPSDEPVEVEGNYYLCVNTPEEAADIGNSCWKVSDFPTTLEPDQSLSTTISPVIDSDVPDEYRVPGDRGQGISFDTNSDVVGGVSVEDSLELLPRYDSVTEATPTETTTEYDPTETATTNTDSVYDPTETLVTTDDTDFSSDSDSTSGVPEGSSTGATTSTEGEGLLSPVMRDVAALMGASGVTLTALYRYFTSN